MFVKTIRSSAIKNGVLLGAAIALGAALLVWPQAAATGVSRGLSICSGVIIPSLFPFLVLAGFLVRSGISAAIGRRLEGITRALFGLPGCCAAGILLSIVGGYPAGGAAVGELLRQGSITRGEARRMLRFCVNAGPAFVISAVGAGMLGSVRAGVVLFSAHVAASLLLGIGAQLLDRRRPAAQPEPIEKKAPVRPLTAPAAFVEGVNSACRSLLYMCGFVVLFAALLSLADVSGVRAGFSWLLSLPLFGLEGDTKALSCVFPCLLEVSCGCVEAAQTGAAAPLLLGMAMGWGGLSVHCQLAAMLHEWKVMGKGFFAARLLHALVAGLLTVLLFRIVPMPLEVFKPINGVTVEPFSISAVASVALLTTCAMLLLVTRSAGKKALDSGGDLC